MADALGITRGERDGVATDEELDDMFADEQPTDEENVPAEPAFIPDDDGDTERVVTDDQADIPEDISGESPDAATPVEGQPDGQEPVVEPGTTEEELTAEVDEQAKLYAGRFQKVEDLERSYGEIQGAFTRIAQDQQASEAELEETRQLLEQQQVQFDQLVAMLQAQQAEQDPEFAERLAAQQRVNQLVDQRIQPFEQAEQARAEQEEQDAQLEQARAAAQQVALTFFARHPDVQPESEADKAMTQTLYELRQGGVPLYVDNLAHLELAFEASKDEALKQELLFTPNAVNVPNGVDVLRQRAGATMQRTETPPPDGTRTRTSEPVRKRLEGFVETGSGGAPVEAAPGEAVDEYAAAEDWYRRRYNKGPLFGSQR